ncbi:sensor histidine kinase [Kitasatospora sp. NPDC001664]|uniref:sensor histidine kinase n=1 Tax=Kitasatospora albolonga TaxID=68173 RepID=UPI0035EF145F
MGVRAHFGPPPGGAAQAEGVPWTHTDALVAAGACALNVLSYVFFGDPTGEHQVSVAGLLLIAVAALPLLFRRSHPLPVLAVVVLLDVLSTLLLRLPTHFGAALIVSVYSVARACPRRVTAAAAVTAAALLSWSQAYGRTVSWQEGISPVLSVLFVVGGALAVNRWQREVAANRQLLADRAVADERRRIARELHDIVAHHITTMQLMAGGARANLANPEVARDALVTLESSGRLALREMRQLLNVLRTGDEPDDAPSAPQPGVEDLDRLVAESDRAGLPTVLTVEGARRPLPPTVGLTVYRIVQEALTNARKHAGPARAEVRLTYRPESMGVEVRDDGEGSVPGAAVPGGHGLVGMRERVALHGGTLTAGPLPEGGFAVLADLPLSPAETAEAAVQNGQENR